MKAIAILVPLLLAGPPSPPAPAPAAASGDVYASNLMVDQDVVVSATITGIIEQIHVDRGSVVAKGQPLATLRTAEFDAEIKQAKESMELAKVQLERVQSLSAGNIMSKADLDEKRAQHAVAVATWEKAKAVREYAVIRAPFAGVISDKQAKIGQKVIENQNIPLFKVTAFEPLLARVYVPEQDLLSIRKGDKVDVVPEKFPKARTTGFVQFISPTVDAASGTFQVVVQVHRDPAQTVLRPGLAVKVHFKNSRRS